MSKFIYVQFLLEQPNTNLHYLNRLVKLLNHFIFIEPPKKPKGYENHHIVPKAKSWKPEWDKIPENHLKVPVKAHYVIHHLMYKAFPKDYAMIEAFHQMSTRLDEKITSKVYEVLKLKFNKVQSEISKKSNAKRVANGTHNFLGGELIRERVANGTHQLSCSKNAKKRVANGTHNFLGPEQNLKRVANGTHNFLGGELIRERVANGTHNFLGGELVKERVINGTHHFLGPEHNQKLLENGTHSFQIKKTCPYCSKTCSIALYGRWHGDRCKSLLEKHI